MQARTAAPENGGIGMKRLCGILLTLVLLLAFVPQTCAVGLTPYTDPKTKYAWYYNLDGDGACVSGINRIDQLGDENLLQIIGKLVDYEGRTRTVTAIGFGSAYGGNVSFKCMPSLAYLDIPSSVREIREHAFEECRSLSTVHLFADSQLTTIGRAAFNQCVDLVFFPFPSGLTTIGPSAFIGTGFTSLDLSGTSLTEIGSSAFSGTGITTLHLPHSIRTIGANAFNTSSPVHVIYEGSEEDWASVSVASGNRFGSIEFTVPSSPTVTWTTSYSATPTNAVVRADFTASRSANWTKSGVYIRNSSGTVIASKEETHNYNMNKLSVWYDINAELGKTLSPDTNYTFEIYTYCDGDRVTTGTKPFKTDVKTTLTFTNTIEEITNDSFTFSLEGRANTTGTFTEYTLTLDDVQTGKRLIDKTVTDDENLCVSGASWFKFVSCNTSRWLYLAQGHTYIYQASYVFNGTRYYSDRYSVTLPDTWTPYFGSVNMTTLSRDRIDFQVDVYDGDQVTDIQCYVYNSVDGPEAAVPVAHALAANEFDASLWGSSNVQHYRPYWYCDVRGSLNIDNVGGRRDCHYYMMVTAKDRSGNTVTQTSEQIANGSYQASAYDCWPVTTKVEVTSADPSQICLDLEGGYPYGVSGFRIAVYPEGGDPDSACVLDVSGAQWKKGQSINGYNYSIYGEGVVIDPADVGLTGARNIRLDVYTLDILGQYSSLEPMSTTVFIDREPPHVAYTSAYVDYTDTLQLQTFAYDDSDLASCTFSYWFPEDPDSVRTCAGTVDDFGGFTASLPWADVATADTVLLYVQAEITDVNGFTGLGLPRLMYRGRGPAIALYGVESVEEQAFSGTSPYFVRFAEDCVSIGNGAFSNCGSLRYVFIPAGVTFIGEGAFDSTVTVLCPPGSAAWEYAVANGNPIVAVYDGSM